MKGMGWAGFGLAPFLKACDMGGTFQPGEVKLEAGMVKPDPGTPRRSLPPIDAAKAERTETATFALG